MLKTYSTIIVLITTLLIASSGAVSSAHAKAGPSFYASKQCSRYFSVYEKLHGIPTHLIKAISTMESGRWNPSLNKKVPWPWTLNVKGKGYYYATKTQAIAAVRKFQRKGIKSIDVGCMQVNLRYHPEAFRNLGQAFSPKYNVAYAAKLLKSHYKRAKKDWHDAVGIYHSKRPRKGGRYARKVEAGWKQDIKQSMRSGERITHMTLHRNPLLKMTSLPVPVKRDDTRLSPEKQQSSSLSARFMRTLAMSFSEKPDTVLD